MPILKKEIESKLQEFLDNSETQKAIKEIKEDNKYIIRFKITNESIDRDWEIIKADGIDWTHFDKNPVILTNHKYLVENIAWKAIERETIWTETYLKVQLAKGVEAWELIKTLHEQGMIKWVSIWFIPKVRDSQNSKIIVKSEALEASFVPIWSNREALIEENAKLYKKWVEFWIFKEVDVIETKQTIKVWDNITYREKFKRIDEEWNEVERVFPIESELPMMWKVIALYEEWQLLNWNELIVPTKENPFIIVQSYVKSKAGPSLLRTYTNSYELDKLKIESIVTQKEIDDCEVEFKSVEKEILDSNKVFDNMNLMKNDISFIKEQIKLFADDKAKAQNLSKVRELWKELQKSLSALNAEAKSQ